MDFTFINELSKAVATTNIFMYAFTGGKVLALGLLVFRILEAFTKDFDSKEPKIGNLMSIMGYGLVIMSSDWIMMTIDNIFSSVDVAMSNTSSDLFTQLNDLVNKKLKQIFETSEDWWDYIGAICSNFLTVMGLAFSWIIGACFKLADLSITAGYLIQRLFILKFLQFLFPLTIALSTYTGTAKLFSSWILRYIGVFILGVAYIGIIKITNLLLPLIVKQFDIGSEHYGVIGDTVNGGIFGIGILTAIVVSFTVKVKLFAMVTNYVSNMFQ